MLRGCEDDVVRIVLEVAGGPHAGMRATKAAGKVLEVGRDGAGLRLPQDTALSRRHFTIEGTASTCILRDLGSTNGTKLNGRAVTLVELRSGDRIDAGDSWFCVRLEAARMEETDSAERVGTAPRHAAPASLDVTRLRSDAADGARHAGVASATAGAATPSLDVTRVRPAPSATAFSDTAAGSAAISQAPPTAGSAARIGSLIFAALPTGWHVCEHIALRPDDPSLDACSVVLTEGELEPGMALARYVERQRIALTGWIDGAASTEVEPRELDGAEEVLAVQVRFSNDRGDTVVQDQIYARRGHVVGVVTLTATEGTCEAARPAFDAIVAALALAPLEPRAIADTTTEAPALPA
jgi:pSer/pThr/pTyr-binding forkhead associated (FHA) protein